MVQGTRNLFYVAVVNASLMNSAPAKCVSHPEIRARATVEACVAVTFGASDSKLDLGGTEPWSLYKPGDSLSGTLLTVSVKTSSYVWTDSSDHWTNGTRLWAKGEMRSLFVRVPAADGCPKILPVDISVQTQRVCCDSGGWECLLPKTVALVQIVSAPANR